ncbi:hypothetical protein Tco_0400425, partial [Tanacetum coccineum]
PNVNTGRANVNSVKSNVNSVRPNVNTGRENVNSVRTNVNTGRSKQPVPTSNLNSFSPVRPQGNWGTAVKTSAGYNWKRTRPYSNYNSRSNFVRTDHPLKNMEDRVIFDNGCSGHMTGNKDHLDDFEECKRGSVTFGGSKGYITGKDSVMSDSDESGVTYTEISSTFEELSDIGSPGVVPSPDYIPGPEEPQSPPPLDYVPEPIYPEYMPQEDEVFPAEEQPLPAAASPTAQSPDYVPESDPEADPEEDDDEDPEEDPVDYPADGGDDGDDEEGSSEDDDMDIEADDDEEEEHPAPADSVVVALPAADQAPSAEETEPFETDESAATPPPHPAYRVTARISIPAPVPTPVWSDAEIRLHYYPEPISNTTDITRPLPVSSPMPVLSPSPPPSPIHSLGYRAAMIRLRAEAASTSHSLPLPPPFILSPTRSDAPSSGIPPPLPISVLTSSPPLLLPSASRREDRPEVTLPPRKRLGIALGPRYEVGERTQLAAAIANRWRGTLSKRPQSVGRHMIAFERTRTGDTLQRDTLQQLQDSYHTAGIARTRWRSGTDRAARGGW